MSDPRRMIELEGAAADGTAGDAATPLERELLLAGRGQKLSPRNKDRIWMGISAQVLPPVMPNHPLTGSEAGAAAATGLGAKTLTAAAVKGAIVVAMLGGGTLAGYQAIGSRRAAPRPVPTQTATPSSAVAPVVEPLARPLEVPPPPAQTPAARGAREEAVGHHQQPSRLAEEGRVILEARRALREGNAQDALSQLEAARGKFVDGAMVQEREALTIEALYRAGQQEAARRRAASFLSAYPGSPHAASVRTFGAP